MVLEWSWPPLAAYPTTIADLGKQAEVWGRHFKADGDMVTAYRRRLVRRLVALLEEQIDVRLKAGSVLPKSVFRCRRTAKIGFGKNSETLYEAVKQLTGLDQLSDIAEGCAFFGVGNRTS